MAKKILTNLWDPLADSLKGRFDSACLKRDAYLDLVFRHEARMLDEEMPERNSAAARACIAAHLGKLKRKQVNLLLSAETTQLITEVCTSRNVPRDAFINRVLLLLLARPAFIKRVFEGVDWARAREKLLESGPDEKYLLMTPNRLDAIADVVKGDPFWYLRACIGLIQEEDDTVPPLHRTMITKDALAPKVESALGFNCFLPDNEVEGHPAHRAREQEATRLLAELLGEIENLP